MSHFVVLVIGDDVEKQLEPFWELDLKHEDLIKDPRAEFCLKIPEKELEKSFQKWRLEEKTRTKSKTKAEDFSNDYADAKLWTKAYYGYDYEEGKGWGYYHNPNAKWDWYQIGGRWTGFFKLKKYTKGVLGSSGTFNNSKTFDADSAKKGDIDFKFMREESKKLSNHYWMEFERQCKPEKKSGRMIRVSSKEKKIDFSKEKVKQLAWLNGIKIVDGVPETKAQYIKRNSGFSTFAVLKDGKWYEKGSMGWWGCVSDEKKPEEWQEEFNKLIDGLSKDTLLTIVDCHI